MSHSKLAAVDSDDSYSSSDSESDDGDLFEWFLKAGQSLSALKRLPQDDWELFCDMKKRIDSALLIVRKNTKEARDWRAAREERVVAAGKKPRAPAPAAPKKQPAKRVAEAPLDLVSDDEEVLRPLALPVASFVTPKKQMLAPQQCPGAPERNSQDEARMAKLEREFDSQKLVLSAIFETLQHLKPAPPAASSATAAAAAAAATSAPAPAPLLSPRTAAALVAPSSAAAAEAPATPRVDQPDEMFTCRPRADEPNDDV